MTTDDVRPVLPAPLLDENDWLAGLRYCHQQLNSGSLRLFEALSYCYAISEVLIARGLVGIEELDQRKDAAATRIAGQFQQQHIGVRMGEERDKYSLTQEPRIDCASRRSLCRAACCKLDFALSSQDVEEGVIRWKLDQPYLNRKGANGYCIHLDQETWQCTIYEQRPAICRLYSCRNDQQVWLDYDNAVLNPALVTPEAVASEAAKD